MGIIQTQTIKGTIYSYLGIGIGFIVGIIFPLILSSEEIGLLNLMVSFSVIFAQFASLGFLQVINRLFPYFREKESGHNGLLFIALVVSTAGFILSIIGLEVLKPVISSNNVDNADIFENYIAYLIPLIFFTVFFNLFDSYSKALFQAVIGTVLKELVQRMFILAAVGLYFINLIDFHQFVLYYTIALSLPTLILLVVLIWYGEFRVHLPKKAMFHQYKKEIFDICFYGVLIGFGGSAIIQIDKILVNKFLGLSFTGIYATNFLFATIILIPSRPLIKIATTILAEAWKRNDLKEIQVIYSKSSINQAIIAILLFIGLWVNIENIYFIIPREYEAGKWVIFFVGLANVFDMFTGINSVIIQTSQYFRINALITLAFLVLIVGFNLIFIPLMGITGAGVAALLSVVITNLLRYLYLKIKFGLVLFNKNLLVIVLAASVAYFAAYLIPRFDNFIVDIAIRSSVCGLIFMVIIIAMRVSEEINSVFFSILKLLGIKFRF